MPRRRLPPRLHRRTNLGSDAQQAAIEHWAAIHRADVVGWHVDIGVSGGAVIARRDGLLAALGALAEHRAVVFVVAKRDRLARDILLSAMIEQLANRLGARIVSAAGEGSDERDEPAGLLMRRLIDAFAEYERGVVRARMRAAMGVKRCAARGSGPSRWATDWPTTVARSSATPPSKLRSRGSARSAPTGIPTRRSLSE